MIKIKAWNASNSTAIAKFTKLPLLLTPLTYFHVGDAETDYFRHKMFVHDLIRGSLISAYYGFGHIVKPERIRLIHAKIEVKVLVVTPPALLKTVVQWIYNDC